MTNTFLLLQLDSEGAAYSEVAELLEDLGFRPETEGYDFRYDWGRPATIAETLGLADRIQETLRGKRVGFRIESTEE
jgi:GH15 family glucan-1,4-alpha-glucosidase